MPDQEEIMEALGKMQTLQNSAEAYQEAYQDVQENLLSLQATEEAIGELEEGEEGTRVLVPLGSGAFAIAEIASVENVIVELGADTYAKKEMANARAIIDERKEGVEEKQAMIEEKLQEINEQLQELAPKLQALQQQMQA